MGYTRLAMVRATLITTFQRYLRFN